MFLILLSTKRGPGLYHANKCVEYLHHGRKEIMRSFSHGSLAEKEAVSPIVVVSKICQTMLSDFTGGLPDLVSSYEQYFSKLVGLWNTNHITQTYLLYFRAWIYTISHTSGSISIDLAS
jgi:hypothetical protein